MKKIAFVFLLSLLLPGFAQAKRYKIKIATLAPKGSSWMKVLQAMKWELKNKSKGKIRLKIYAGGRMGDEKVVVGKMKLGTLHGAALTSIGLAQINKALLSLQLPFLFRKYKELDCTRTKLDKVFRQMLLDKGFVLLGWGDVGYIYIFSKRKLATIADMKKAKMWAWTDDPLTQHFAKIAGFTPRLLGLLHVRNGLQTGIVDTVVSTPLTLIAMQWHTYVKYRIAYKFAIGLGATVIRKQNYDKLPANLQKILMETSLKYHKKLIKIIRKDNKRAKYTLKRRGMKNVRMNKAQRRLARKFGRRIWKHFSGGRFYKSSTLKLIRKTLRSCRK
jgi:TRAP-type C4-dicarboxylate transport system substrate-binding protein